MQPSRRMRAPFLQPFSLEQALLTRIYWDAQCWESYLCNLHQEQHLKNKDLMFDAVPFPNYVSELIQDLYFFTMLPKLKRQINNPFVHLHKLFPVWRRMTKG